MSLYQNTNTVKKIILGAIEVDVASPVPNYPQIKKQNSKKKIKKKEKK